MYDKILCPIDFSPGSQVALQLAATMAARSGAELAIVHSRYLPPIANAGEFALPVDAIHDIIEDEKRGLAASANDAAKLGAKRVSTRLVEGVPWDRIASLARDEHSDLIVIGTHGRTGLSRFVLGSMAEQVVRHAPCSVLVARACEGTPPFRRVLCPIDFSESSREALRSAAELVAPDGTLAMFHAIQLPTSYRAALPAELLAGFERDAKHTLEQWAAQLGPRVTPTISTAMGLNGPADQTLEHIEGNPGFDLIAVGSHGRTGLRRILLGSVAEKIVRHAPCSVLVARSRAGQR